MSQPNPVAFSLWGIDIKWYGILIATGFLLAIIISYYKAPRHKISQDFLLNFAIVLIPVSIIGARLYYVIFSFDYYRDDLLSILDIRSGGLAIHGGIIAGVLVGVLMCHHYNINLLNLGDLVFPQVALAQSIGRWGNFFNGEAHGGVTDLPWAILVNGQKVHPTFLYESLWCLLLFVLLSFMDRNRKFTGQITCLYGMLYSLERFFVEALRTDSLMIGPFRQAQLISIAIFSISLLGYIYLKKKQGGNGRI